MISGTEAFIEEDLVTVDRAFGAIQQRGLVSHSEMLDLRAQCEDGSAMCVSCDDGILVFTLQPFDDGIEMFILMALALKFGAFERQESAVRAIARDIGAQTIAFQARRRGWARRLGPAWHRRGSLEFYRSV